MNHTQRFLSSRKAQVLPILSTIIGRRACACMCFDGYSIRYVSRQRPSKVRAFRHASFDRDSSVVKQLRCRAIWHPQTWPACGLTNVNNNKRKNTPWMFSLIPALRALLQHLGITTMFPLLRVETKLPHLRISIMRKSYRLIRLCLLPS
jgi:hypothetical protein